MRTEKEKSIGVSGNRYKILFSFENAYAVFHKKDDSKGVESTDYECKYYANHDCVFPVEVLVDMMFCLRSGDFRWLVPGDILCVRVNGQLHSYRFDGIRSWNPNDVYSNFCTLDSRFFIDEKEDIIKKLHKDGYVLDVLNGNTFSVKDDENIAKYSFYGIEKESYPLKSLKTVAEYSVYSLEDDQIRRVNPNGNPFYDLKNALFFFFRKCKGKCPSILLFNRKELEMIKDYSDFKTGFAYEA